MAHPVQWHAPGIVIKVIEFVKKFGKCKLTKQNLNWQR
jgi:hypothetical protein